MATNEADLEYGPTPEHADHEHTDIEPSIAWKFAIWLVVAMLISAAIVYGTFWFFERGEERADEAAMTFPLAQRGPNDPLREPTGPTLQRQPFKDLYRLRQDEQKKLSEYGWVDKSSGTVHIPIDAALVLMEQKGLLPARTEPAAAAQLNQVVMDSSAGRTVAPR